MPEVASSSDAPQDREMAGDDQFSDGGTGVNERCGKLNLWGACGSNAEMQHRIASIFAWPAIVMAVLCASASAAASSNLDPIRPATEQAIARIKPALVRIHVVSVAYSQGREVKQESSGSGFIIRSDGYVVTNHHVAGRATRLVCVFADNEEIEATLVGTDPLTDIAVLKLANPGGRVFPVVEWGDSAAVRVGDTVLAMGSPLALSQSVTRGIVSNAKMTLPDMLRRGGGFSLEGEDVGSLVRWIAHDAPIYPGNSGGPLADLAGRIIGVNEISLGLSGAIPSDIARDVAEQIIVDGRVTRSWFGFEVQPLLKGSGASRGVLLSGVMQGSPAEAAGFKRGDILLQLAGEDITVRFTEELPLLNLLMTSIPVGKEVPAVVMRGGKELRLKVRAAEREPPVFRQREFKEWGFTGKDISFMAAKEQRLETRDGVLVSSTRPGGPSGEAKPGIQSGDIIETVAGKPVASVADLAAVTSGLVAGKSRPVPVVVGFRRREERLLTVVKVGIRDIADPSTEAQKAWFPAGVQVLTRDLAEQLGAAGATGVRITRTYADTPAGFRVGDLITAIDGEKIPASQPGDEEVFANILRRRRVGDRPEFTVLRGDQTLKLTGALASAPRAEREMRRFEDPHFEFTARDISFLDRTRNRLPEDARGALVSEVKDGGWAALGELQANDIIETVAGKPITDVAELEAAMRQLAANKADYVVLSVRRGIRVRYLELEPSWERGK
jgi:serine protease Do